MRDALKLLWERSRVKGLSEQRWLASFQQVFESQEIILKLAAQSIGESGLAEIDSGRRELEFDFLGDGRSAAMIGLELIAEKAGSDAGDAFNCKKARGLVLDDFKGHLKSVCHEFDDAMGGSSNVLSLWGRVVDRENRAGPIDKVLKIA